MNDDTDKILQAEMSDEDTIVALASLCRHRGKCMDTDAEMYGLLQVLSANQECIIEIHKKEIEILKGIPIWTRWVISINNWAKS
jgi:hypothetical protein